MKQIHTNNLSNHTKYIVNDSSKKKSVTEAIINDHTNLSVVKEASKTSSISFDSYNTLSYTTWPFINTAQCVNHEYSEMKHSNQLHAR